MNPTSTSVPLAVADLSAFCKSLRHHLIDKGCSDTPSHVILLNLVAKSAGFRNYQTLRASTNQSTPPPVPLNPPKRSDLPKAVLRSLGHFDTAGRLMRWPTQYAIQQIALWGLWCRLPASKEMSEREVNECLSRFNSFDDHVTLRRELVNLKLLWRTSDGRRYRRLTADGSNESRLFVRELLRATNVAAKA